MLVESLVENYIERIRIILIVELVDQGFDEYRSVSWVGRLRHELANLVNDVLFDSDFTDVMIDRDTKTIIVVDGLIECSEAKVDVVSSIFIEKSVIITRNLSSWDVDDWKTGVVCEVGKHVYDENNIQL